MKIHAQQPLPGCAPAAVSGVLYVHQDDRGRVTLGWEVRDTATREHLALGATPPLTAEEAVSDAHDLLDQLLGLLPTLVERGPFS